MRSQQENVLSELPLAVFIMNCDPKMLPPVLRKTAPPYDVSLEEDAEL